MIKAIALDDEPLALEIIQTYAQTLNVLELVNTFTRQDKALRYINKFEVDLLFLDINMPQLNGVALYRSLKHHAKVIFTTAYSYYAVEGFEVNASDYLLKPFSRERFVEAVNRVQQQLELERNSAPATAHLTIRADYKLHHIPLNCIYYLEALDDYIKIHCTDRKTIVARASMKSIFQKLPPDRFKRIHRSYIVPLEQIVSISKHGVHIGNLTLPLGSAYKKDFF